MYCLVIIGGSLRQPLPHRENESDEIYALNMCAGMSDIHHVESYDDGLSSNNPWIKLPAVLRSKPNEFKSNLWAVAGNKFVSSQPSLPNSRERQSGRKEPQKSSENSEVNVSDFEIAIIYLQPLPFFFLAMGVTIIG